MSLRSTWAVHQRRPALRKLDHPPVLHRVDATQRQIDLPHDPGVVGVDDFRNSTKVLNDLSTAAQQRVELLTVGMPLLLAIRQIRREVHEHHQRGRLRVALPKDPPDRIAAAIGSHLIGSTCRRGSSEPRRSGLNGSPLIGDRQRMLFLQQVLQPFNRSLLLCAHRPRSIRPQLRPQRSRDLGVRRARMRPRIAGRTQKLLEHL